LRIKLALAGEGGGPRPPPLITFTIPFPSKVAVYAPAERADTLTLFHLYENMYSVVRSVNCTYGEAIMYGNLIKAII
jgi:hypothetical protein